MTDLDTAMNNGGLTLFGAHIYSDTTNPIWPIIQYGGQVNNSKNITTLPKWINSSKY